jgi:hypothetical protein
MALRALLLPKYLDGVLTHRRKSHVIQLRYTPTHDRGSATGDFGPGEFVQPQALERL